MQNNKPFELTQLDALIEYPFFVEIGQIMQVAEKIATRPTINDKKNNRIKIYVGSREYETQEDKASSNLGKGYGEYKRMVLISRDGNPIFVSQIILGHETSQDFPEDTTQTKSKKVLTSLLVKDEFAEEILRRAINQ